MPGFMFATGIENSYPTIAAKPSAPSSRSSKSQRNGPSARTVRVDEMEKCGHYKLWKEDLRLLQEMDLHYLRWGPANYKTFLGPGKYDWSWTDEVLAEMRRLGIWPIIDLCHFGVPDWL